MSGLAYYVVVLLVYLGSDLLAAWGLNLEFGVAGVANFAYIVLVAAGAYVYSVLTLGPSSAGGGFQSYIIGLHLPVVAAILIAMAAAAALGGLIGVTGLRRLRPDYQAMVTLVISLMAITVVSADTGLVNGNAGLAAIPNPLASLTGAAQGWGYAALTGLACLAVYPLLRRFTAGPLGRTLRAIRDDENAAIAIGKNVVALRLVVQGVGGALAGLSGALLAGFIGGWSPSAWQYVETLALLTAIIVGGLGDDLGVLVGTVIVPVLILQGVQFLPQISNHAQLTEDLGWIILGALTIAFIWLRPRGLIPERRPAGLVATARLAGRSGTALPGGSPLAGPSAGGPSQDGPPSAGPPPAGSSLSGRPDSDEPAGGGPADGGPSCDGPPADGPASGEPPGRAVPLRPASLAVATSPAGRRSGIRPRGRSQMNAMVSAPRMIQPRSSVSWAWLLICGRNWTPCRISTGTITVPTRTPRSSPRPPTMIAVSSARVSTYCHADGDQPPMNPASKAPLSPASAPPTPWTTSRNATTFLPIAIAAFSSSRMARNVRPSGPAVNRRSSGYTARQARPVRAAYPQPWAAPVSEASGFGIAARPALPFTSPVSALTTVMAISEITSVTIAW